MDFRDTPEEAEYRVTLRRGEVEPSVGKYLSGGAPDLGVEIDVAGERYALNPLRKPPYDPAGLRVRPARQVP